MCSGCQAEVRLPDILGGPIVRVTNCNLTPLAANTIVEFHSLETNAELNGACGHVTQEPMDSDKKLCVHLAEENIKKVHITKIRPCCRLWGLNLQMTQSWLQWRKEQKGHSNHLNRRHKTFFRIFPS